MRPTPVVALQQNVSVETELLTEMLSADKIEIAAGEVARSRGTIGEIRNLGVLLVRDHRDANGRIQNVAKKQRIGLTERAAKTPEERYNIDDGQTGTGRVGIT